MDMRLLAFFLVPISIFFCCCHCRWIYCKYFVVQYKFIENLMNAWIGPLKENESRWLTSFLKLFIVSPPFVLTEHAKRVCFCLFLTQMWNFAFGVCCMRVLGTSPRNFRNFAIKRLIFFTHFFCFFWIRAVLYLCVDPQWD